MTCSQCSLPAERAGFCNKHWHLSVWLDNSDQNHLGIVQFAKDIVPEWVREETTHCHKEMLYNFFQLYRKENKNKTDRQMAVVGFRGMAKTTWSKIILLYICCFGLEKLVAYASETSVFAKNDTLEVRRELTQNKYIIQYFGKISSKGLRGQDGEWTRDAYTTATGVSVLPRGAGQQIRSALKNSYRITLFLVNDMYGKDDVKTEHSREEKNKWFFTESGNAVDDVLGKVFFNGTILHEDTVPVLLKGNQFWKYFEYPVMDIEDFYKLETLCVKTEDKCILPFYDANDDTKKAQYRSFVHEFCKENHIKTNWEDRLPSEYVLTKYAEAYEARQVDGFFQEYFHITSSPEAKTLAKFHVVSIKYFWQYKNWIVVKYGNGTERTIPVNIYLGVDPASSESSHAKFSVISLVAISPKRELFVLYYSRGKYGLRDELKQGVNRDSSDVIISDKSLIQRVGIVDETIRLIRQFRPNGGQVETTQAQEHIFTDIRRLMGINGAYVPLYSDKPVQNKIVRDAEMIYPYSQTGNFYINEKMPELEMELKSFPSGKTIDIIDSIYHAVAKSRPPEGDTFTNEYKRKVEPVITDHDLLCGLHDDGMF